MFNMPHDRAPGPHGFSGLFFKKCCEIIADDLMAAMEALHEGQFYFFGASNSSILTLLPKKDNPLQLGDFRPINLIHGVAKIFAKVLEARLSPLLPSLISQAQSAFVSNKSIHENFKFVRNAARMLHQQKRSAVLLKIDISKAFDTISWDFLLEVLRCRGFGPKWCSWICGLLSTASSSVLINGELSDPFTLACGVRQGDPLSPALFILAMDSLQAMMNWAAHQNLLAPLGFDCRTPRASIFADDAVLFLKPEPTDLQVTSAILELFGEPSGLRINLQKSTSTCIRCGEALAVQVAQHFQCQNQAFTLKYLGLPLSIYKLRKQDVMPLVDKYSSKMKGWKPKLLAPAGRLALTSSVLLALPIHFSSVLPLPVWAIKIIERRCRGFVWKGEEETNGGHCLLPWAQVCRPKEYGGLGIINLRYFGTALRCRWPWMRWDQVERSWLRFPDQVEKEVAHIFSTASVVALGGGNTAKFWIDN